MSEKIKIIFVGSQNYGAQCLQYLLDSGDDIKLVFTFDPEDHETWINEVEVIANKQNIPVIKTKKLEKYLNKIANISPDVIFVIGWRTLIPKEIFLLPPLGCIGIHGSLLPKYRGFAPLNWALINGEKEIGVSMFYIGEGIDTGEIIAQKRIIVDTSDDMQSIKEKFDNAIVKLFIEQYHNVKNNNIISWKQKEEDATFGCMRKPEDGEINWKLSAKDIFNHILALGKPFPEAFTYYKGSKIYILKAKVVEDSIPYIGIPGAILKVIKNKGVLILTGDGILFVKTIRLEYNLKSNATAHITGIGRRLGMNYTDEIEELKKMIEELKK